MEDFSCEKSVASRQVCGVVSVSTMYSVKKESIKYDEDMKDTAVNQMNAMRTVPARNHSGTGRIW